MTTTPLDQDPDHDFDISGTATVASDSVGGDDADDAAAEGAHWRVGRFLPFLLHVQEGGTPGWRDRPIGLMRSASLAAHVASEVNALGSAHPWITGRRAAAPAAVALGTAGVDDADAAPRWRQRQVFKRVARPRLRKTPSDLG